MSTAAEREVKRQLKAVGLSEGAIKAAWPQWWSSDADASPSAKLELRFSLARKLGVDPRSLLDAEGIPRFMWRDEARFKHLSRESEQERAGISSFGRALGTLLVGATEGTQLPKVEVLSLRSSVLSSQPFVRLSDLLSICWSLGIPVVYLRVFPQSRKRMAAMAVRVGERGAILLAREAQYPAQVAFYLAHELGHLFSGHIEGGRAIVDLADSHPPSTESDPEEQVADRFALELLTGSPEPVVATESKRYNAPGLASAVLRAGRELRIEPGTLALCFGYSTHQWALVNSAMRFIYRHPRPVWQDVNRVALQQLRMELIPEDARSYLRNVLGLPVPE